MVGVDEVGRGCLAGPLLVVAARAKTEIPRGLKDSKLLSRRQREKIYPILVESFEFGEGWVSPLEIDKLGLGHGLKLGVRRALERIKPKPDEEIIIDGIVNYIPATYNNSRCQVDADEFMPLVSAASIYAKVTRDRFMLGVAEKYPEYHFDQHVGYATADHFQALEELGPIKSIHRLSFAPLRQVKLL